VGIERTATAVDGRGRRVAVVGARFNATYADMLVDGAVAALTRHGVAAGDVRTVRVPGAFELPIAVQRALANPAIDGVVAAAVIVRGGTPHFDYVAKAVTDGVLRAQLDARKPAAFAVLTCDTAAQAAARCGGEHGNKGAEAAEALLELLAALEAL